MDHLCSFIVVRRARVISFYDLVHEPETDRAERPGRTGRSRRRKEMLETPKTSKMRCLSDSYLISAYREVQRPW